MNTSIREKQEQIEDVKQNIAGLQADWNSRMNGGKLVDPAARSLLIAFLGQLSKEQSAYEQELQSLMQERDAVFERYAELANFAQGLDDHRESKLQEFKVEANASAAAAADDMWLQRSAWLKVRV
ncbi:hypothetical protein [Parachitinimonas caeni]|uniref:Flagellar FliJ protein n=1 Tax=Parachitinimonas caeni TaxID=3031301 RepID=A0ABT7E2J0_9NEIS|nr:hypothetical protein [Parachitinimonas caeni]MDK2125127.1 hypothetical protein [Parachitinimonas caeni]